MFSLSVMNEVRVVAQTVLLGGCHSYHWAATWLPAQRPVVFLLQGVIAEKVHECIKYSFSPNSDLSCA